MAQAQTKKPAQKRRTGSTNSRSNASSAKRASRSASGSSKTARSRSTQSQNGKGTVESVKDTVSSGAQDAAETVSDFASKTKTGLIAGGAAAAGLVATVIVTQRSRRGPTVLGVKLPKRNSGVMPNRLIPKSGGIKRDTRKIASKVADAADRAERIGQRVSNVASSVKQVSESADQAAKKA
jgi:hypothetical protein